MSEMESFKPKEKPVSVNQDTKQERLEDSHTPNVTPAKDDGQVPAQVNPPSGNDNGSNNNDTGNAETPSQRRLHKLGITGTSSMSGKIVPSDENRDIENNDDIPCVSPSIPGYSPNKEVAEPSDWKDLGIVNVPVADLPNPDGVSSPEDFNHHISWEDAKSATEQLPQVQQEVAAGKTGDDFLAEDQAAGLDHQHGRKRVYDLYYSNTDPIQMDKDGDQYIINSGRHRVYAVQSLGLGTVPARVREKQVD